MDRREFITLGVGAAVLTQAQRASAAPAQGSQSSSVITPNGRSLPWKIVDGVKVGHLVAGAVDHEFQPGLRAECWGYNGSTPGPTIEMTEGDRVRIYVTNRLPEPTTVHWHGMIVPNGMDGVSGLNQRPIPVGETWVYEFVARRAGTFMYHSHYDEMVQIALGLVGMIVVHPKNEARPAHDFALLLHEWSLKVGAKRPDPMEMTEFNVLTINGRSYPGTDPLLVQRGARVRVRFGNLSPMDHHPMHAHGVSFKIVETDGGPVPPAAQVPETTVLVPVGSVRVIELVPEELGDWALHCHMTHHVMTQMGHGLPSMLGADTTKLDERLARVVPKAMTMGQSGMGEMMQMPIPPNSAPMRASPGPFAPIDMGGMFTIIKVREHIEGVDPKSWYAHPKGTVAAKADEAALARDGVDPKSGT